MFVNTQSSNSVFTLTDNKVSLIPCVKSVFPTILIGEQFNLSLSWPTNSIASVLSNFFFSASLEGSGQLLGNLAACWGQPVRETYTDNLGLQCNFLMVEGWESCMQDLLYESFTISQH